MIPVLKDVLRWAPCHVWESSSHRCSLAGCGGSDDSGKETVIAGFYPLAWAAERVAGDGVRRRESHAGRCRASRPRAHTARRGADRGCRHRPLPGPWLPACPRGRGARTVRRRRPARRTGAVRPRWRGRRFRFRPAHLARPRALRRCRHADRQRSSVGPTRAADLAAELDELDAELEAGLARLRAAGDRDEPRGLRVPRGSRTG